MSLIKNNMPQLVADFKEDFPKFPQLFEDEIIEKAIGESDKFLDPDVWGVYEKYSFYRDGWFNLVAHSLFISAIEDANVELGQLPGSKRGIDSVMIDGESTTFGTQMFLKMQPWDDEMASSSYGVKFLRLREDVSRGLFGFYG